MHMTRDALIRDSAGRRCRPTLDHFHHGAATAGSQCGQIRWVRVILDGVTDPYLDGLYRWWHLTGPSPELLAAAADGWLDAAATADSDGDGAATGPVLDVGCGLGSEVSYLAGTGWRAVGIDLSWAAVSRARLLHVAKSDGCMFACADLLRLPFGAGSFALAVDRGCFHYLPRERWREYAAEVHRVLRPGGRLLLRVPDQCRGPE
jgi:SAM-dependent methyltransferase